MVLQAPRRSCPGRAFRPWPASSLRSPHHQLHRVLAGWPRGGLRTARPRLERRLALGRGIGPPAATPSPGTPASPGDLILAAALGDDSGDDQAHLRHPPTVTGRVFLCLETLDSDVLRLDTSERAMSDLVECGCLPGARVTNACRGALPALTGFGV